MRSPHKRRSGKKKYVLIALAVVLLGVGGFFGWKTFAGGNDGNQKSRAEQQEQEADKYPNRIRLIASGDMVAHDSVNENAKQSGDNYDYYPQLENMAPVFEASDIRFCNQVTVAGGKELGVAGYPMFNAPTELVRDLAKTGCNLVNMASNHSFDKSQEAINNNVAAWEAERDILAAAGQNRSAAERDETHTFTVKGVKFAFLAYTTYMNGGATFQNDYGATRYSRDFAAQQIKEAKASGADVIIVSMRWGTEYAAAIDAEQEAESEFLADQGVSLILGHGPHVLQPVKKLQGADGNETVVWYSLGNFLNTQLETEALFNGLAVVDFNAETKAIDNIAYLPILSAYAWTAQQAANEDLLSRTDVKLHLLDDATQEVIDKIQLNTTVEAQRSRIADTLNTFIEISLLSEQQYLQ